MERLFDEFSTDQDDSCSTEDVIYVHGIYAVNVIVWSA
jgi:hypothetical protein